MVIRDHAPTDLRWRHLVQCRQELDDHGDLRLADEERHPRRAVQGAEHVESFVSVPRGRRDRPRTGGAGGGVRARARDGHESDSPEAQRQRDEPGDRQWARLEDASGPRLLRLLRRAAVTRACGIRGPLAALRCHRHRGRGQRERAQSTRVRPRESRSRDTDSRSVGARGRHRTRRRLRIGSGHRVVVDRRTNGVSSAAS